MTRASEDNTPPDAPHASGSDADPHRGKVFEARPDPLRDLPRSYEDAVAEVGRWRGAYDAVLDELQAMLRESGLTMRQALDTVRRLVADGHGRREVHRRLLDILGWDSGTDEQALEALADAVRVARGGRMGKDVHLQRNEARAECERLVRRDGELTAVLERRGEESAELRRQLDSCHERAADLAGHYRQLVQERNEARAECERLQRELRAAREAVGEGWFAGGATLAEAIRRKVHVLECERENRLADEHPPAPVEGPEGGAR